MSYEGLLSELVSIAKKYDPDLSYTNNKKFFDDLHDLNKGKAVPLTAIETFVLRSILGINNDRLIYSPDTLARVLSTDTNTIRHKVDKIKNILRDYFYQSNNEEKEYNNSINDINKNVTIFECGLSQAAIDKLRTIKVYYLRDITSYKRQQLHEILSQKDYYKLIDTMNIFGICFDNAENIKNKTRA